MISLCYPITSVAACYQCFTVALLVTFLLDMCETTLKLFVLHPIKFYRLVGSEEESDSRYEHVSKYACIHVYVCMYVSVYACTYTRVCL